MKRRTALKILGLSPLTPSLLGANEEKDYLDEVLGKDIVWGPELLNCDNWNLETNLHGPIKHGWDTVTENPMVLCTRPINFPCCLTIIATYSYDDPSRLHDKCKIEYTWEILHNDFSGLLELTKKVADNWFDVARDLSVCCNRIQGDYQCDCEKARFFKNQDHHTYTYSWNSMLNRDGPLYLTDLGPLKMSHITYDSTEHMDTHKI